MGGPLMRGIVQKKTKSMLSPWQPRFVVLTETEINYASKEGATDAAHISLNELSSVVDNGDQTFSLNFKSGSKLGGARSGKSVERLTFKAGADAKAWADTANAAMNTFLQRKLEAEGGPSSGEPGTPGSGSAPQSMHVPGAVDLTPGVTPENSGLLHTPRGGGSDGRLTPKAATPVRARMSGGFDYLGGGPQARRPATPEVDTMEEEAEHSGRESSPPIIADVPGTPHTRASTAGRVSGLKEPSFELLPGAEHSEHHRTSHGAATRQSRGVPPRSPRGGPGGASPAHSGPRVSHGQPVPAENSGAWATLIGQQSPDALSPTGGVGYSPRMRLLSITPGKRLLRAPSVANTASRETSRNSVVATGYTRGESSLRINNVRIMELGIALSACLSNEERAKLYRVFTAYCLFGEPRHLHSALVNGAMGSPLSPMRQSSRSPLLASPSAARPSPSQSLVQLRPSPSSTHSSVSRVGGSGIRPMSAGVYAREESGPRMDGQQFAKVARESRLVDKKLNLGVVGIIFLSVKDMRSRKIGYEDFLQALINIADFKKVTIADIVRQILFSVPLINSVMPANVHASRPKERSPPVESSDPYSTPLAIRPTFFYSQMRPSRPLDLYLPMEWDMMEEPSQPPGTI